MGYPHHSSSGQPKEDQHQGKVTRWVNSVTSWTSTSAEHLLTDGPINRAGQGNLSVLEPAGDSQEKPFTGWVKNNLFDEPQKKKKNGK
jgi:hypothetical protein